VSRKRLLAIGLVVFAITLLLRAPAATVYGWLAGEAQASPVGINGLSGTLSSGRFAGLSVQNQVLLQDLEWKLQPLWLLLGRLAVDLQSTQGTLIEGQAQLRPLAGVVLHDFRFNGGLKPLLAAAGQGFLPVDARLGLNLQQLRIKGGLPVSAEGTLLLQGLAWKLGRDPIVLGDYEAVLSNEGQNIAVAIKSVAGALDLSGDAHLNRDRTYDLHLQMRAKADAPPMITNMLPSLGQPDTQGLYHLRRQGALPGGTPPPAPIPTS
jgi:hypothetical protein